MSVKTRRIYLRKMSRAGTRKKTFVNGGPCTVCGRDHWSPDCPNNKPVPREYILHQFNQLLAYARKQGFAPQLEISFPASKRQAITTNAIYLRPLDGSDKFLCACCGCPYEARDDSFRGTVHVPIGWCDRCREELRTLSYGEVLQLYKKGRRGKMKLIEASVARIHKLIKEQNHA